MFCKEVTSGSWRTVVLNGHSRAVIHYTTNGLVPVQTDPVINAGGFVVITQGMALSARSFRSDLQPSVVTSVTYMLQAGAPVFSPPHGPITNGTLLSISSATPGAVIRYTLDGTDPAASSLIYSGPFSIDISNAVGAQAYKTGLSNSPVSRAFFAGPLQLSPVQQQA